MTATILPARDMPAADSRGTAMAPFFERMVSRQRVDLASVPWSRSQSVIAEALSNCTRCPSKMACSAWLDGAQPPMSYVQFCPNAERIETLRIMGE